MILVLSIAWALAWVGAGLLVVAGVAKVVRPVATADGLAMAGFPSSSPVARLLGVGEAGLGALVLSAVALPSPGPTVAAVAVGTGYLAFAVVAGRLLAAGAASCGCFGEVDAPLSRIHVAVNGVFAVAGLVAATGAPPTTSGPLQSVLAVACVACGVWMVRALLVLVPGLADGIRRLGPA